MTVQLRWQQVGAKLAQSQCLNAKTRRLLAYPFTKSAISSFLFFWLYNVRARRNPINSRHVDEPE